MNREIMLKTFSLLTAYREFTGDSRIANMCSEVIDAIDAELAKPDQAPFKPDWVSYRQGVEDGAAQPEQEEKLPLVDIGVDVTPEGTHVVAFYNRHDAVQEMFYSRFHPLDKPKQEPVAWAVLRPDGRVKLLSHQQGVEVDLKWTPLYVAPTKREWVGLTDEDINKSWEWAQKSSPYGVTRIETFAKSIETKLKERNGG